MMVLSRQRMRLPDCMLHFEDQRYGPVVTPDHALHRQGILLFLFLGDTGIGSFRQINHANYTALFLRRSSERNATGSLLLPCMARSA